MLQPIHSPLKFNILNEFKKKAATTLQLTWYWINFFNRKSIVK